MVTIYLNGKPFEVEEGQTLLAACLSLGFNIPYFCWHPALHSVGSCRLCAVKQFRDEKDTRGRIVMSCVTEVCDGLRVSLDDPEVREFRASVLEWLMINHPHDCPVCDEGGECHLQDMTVMTGHVYRRYRYKKNTYYNQDLGPFIHHEMNRCIQCYRCVRYYRDYAGGRDLNVYGVHNKLYFGRFESGVLQSPFSGNLVEVCPTGVFTDKTHRRHFTRKWDLQTAPSVCVHCGLGCNTIPGERYGTLRRIRNRYNGQVNGYFLCDRGRFGYEFVNSDLRIRQPLIRNDAGELEACSLDRALEHLAHLLNDSTDTIGIGSPRASLESNFALSELVGPERFSAGIPRNELELVNLAVDILSKGPAPSASLLDAEKSDAVLVLGEDLINTAPRLALAVRQSILQEAERVIAKRDVPRWNDRGFRLVAEHAKGPVFLATPWATALDDIARDVFRGAPFDIARVAAAVARDLDDTAPEVHDLTAREREWAAKVADALKKAERPLVVSGISCGDPSVLQAAANLAKALAAIGQPCRIALVVPECNTIGVGLLGGLSLEHAMGDEQPQGRDLAIVMENDLYRRLSRTNVDGFFARSKHLVVVDHLMHETAQQAELVLPAATFAEGAGTMVNSEGRGQRFFRVLSPTEHIRDSWHHFRDPIVLAGRSGVDSRDNLDTLLQAVADRYVLLEGVTRIAPNAQFRAVHQRIPRQSHRYSGRTAMHANMSVHEPKPPEDKDSPLSFSMEGYSGMAPSSLIPRFWAPGWNSIQSLNKFQSEIAGSLVGGDPGIRLLDKPDGGSVSYFSEAVPESQEREDQWLLVPLHHLFGSEELSVLSPGIRQLTPDPYVGMSSEDADSLGIKEGTIVSLDAQGLQVQRPVRIRPDIPRSILAWPVGLPGEEPVELPQWVTVTLRQSDSGEA